MSKRKMHAYVGMSPDGNRRVYAQDQDSARAMAECFDAAREYIKGRPDCGPLSLWNFQPGTNGDYVAVAMSEDEAA
jgi:hypothetical protein